MLFTLQRCRLCCTEMGCCVCVRWPLRHLRLVRMRCASSRTEWRRSLVMSTTITSFGVITTDYNFIGGYYGPGAPTNQGQHLSTIKSDYLVGTQAWVYHSLATAKSGVAYSSLHHTVFHSVSRVSVGSLVWQCHTTPPAGAVSGHSTSYSGGGGYNGGYP